MRILAFDQATLVPGYVAIDWDVQTNQCCLVEGGVIKLSNEDLVSRLAAVYVEVRDLIARLDPHVVSVEDIFLGKNIKTYEKLAKVQGIIQVLALVNKKKLFTVSPLQARSHFDLPNNKKMVASFVLDAFPTLYDISKTKKLDVTDAGLIALYTTVLVGRSDE